MKKLLAVGFCLLGALFVAQAAESGIDWKEYGAGIKEGDFIVHGDIGVTAHSEALPYDGSLKVPYLEASVEYTKKLGGLPLGFGGFIGYAQDGMDESQSWAGGKYKWEGTMNYINVGALLNYHVQLPVEKLDVYAGFRLGLEFYNWKVDYKVTTDDIYGYGGTSSKSSSDSSGTNFYGGLNLGAQYFFTEKFAANVEVGYPAFIKVGGTAKF